MDILIIASLILLGILLFLVEFFLIPGVTIAGIGGFISISCGVLLSYKYFGSTTGSLVMIGSTLLVIFALIKALRGKTWEKIGLNKKITSHVNEINPLFSVGDLGETISRLSPSGKALFNEEIIEVHSEVGYIEQNKKIIISHIKNNKIYVKIR